MSTALADAIYDRLANQEALTGDADTAQNALAALLAVDQVTGAPAVHLGNVDNAVGWPCITFRPAAGREAIGGVDLGVVESGIWDFEVWTNTRDAFVVTNIAEYVERLLDLRRAVSPVMTLSTGEHFWSEQLSPMSLIYDEALNAWAGLTRYQFVEGRAT